jgi:hypothetical protein
MNRSSFVFYKDWMIAIRDLPDDIRLDIYESIIEYATTGSIRGLRPMANIAFNFVKTTIDRDTERYMSIAERNKDNGIKGGRPKKKTQKNPKNPVGYLETQRNPKNLDNVNVNVSVNDNEDNYTPLSPDGDIPPAGDTLSPSPFEKLTARIKSELPVVVKLPQQLTEKQLNSLLEKYNRQEIWDILEDMNNTADLCKKYRNVGRTAGNWLKFRRNSERNYGK